MENEHDEENSAAELKTESTESDNDTKDTKGAGVKIPPPLVLLSFLALAFLADYLIPLSLPDIGLLNYIGGAVVMIGIATLVFLALTFKRENTSIEPWKPTHKILSTGLYGYSRNPIYTGFCVVVIGLGLFVSSVWVLFSFIPIAITIYKTAIVKEERYLETKFGDEYRHYKTQVRRWI